MVNLMSVFEHPDLKDLTEDKKKLLSEMLDLMVDRTSEQQLQILITYGNRMHSNESRLSTKEIRAIMDVLKLHTTTS